MRSPCVGRWRDRVSVTLARPDIQTSTGSFSGVRFDESLGDVCAHSGRSHRRRPTRRRETKRPQTRRACSLTASPDADHALSPQRASLRAFPWRVHRENWPEVGVPSRSRAFSRSAVRGFAPPPGSCAGLETGVPCPASRKEERRSGPYGGSARKSPRVHQFAVTSWPPGTPPGP